jgi:hypothetical protein
MGNRREELYNANLLTSFNDSQTLTQFFESKSSIKLCKFQDFQNSIPKKDYFFFKWKQKRKKKIEFLCLLESELQDPTWV